MNSSNVIKAVVVIIILGIIGLFATGTIQLSSPATRSDTTITAPAPENLSVRQGTGLKADEAFPNFSLTDVDDQTKTLDSLKGKPAIIWFTTSWCIPCQIGARDVSILDNELGGDAFNVLVVFVDLREKNADLINWRKQFANPDWMVTFDNELTKLAGKVNLKFLDSKFLLDKNGVIKNIDFKIADEKYLNVIRGVVKEN